MELNPQAFLLFLCWGIGFGMHIVAPCVQISHSIIIFGGVVEDLICLGGHIEWKIVMYHCLIDNF